MLCICRVNNSNAVMARRSRAPASVARLTLVALVLLAFVLRSYRLGAQSLWYDEAVTAYVAAQGIPELTRWTADDIQPPLYYYAVAGWTRLAGRAEWALRFPSVCFGTLTVSMIWALGRRLFGNRVGKAGAPAPLGPAGRTRLRGGVPACGVAAALLAAISPLYVYYSQEARMYTQLTFLGALSGYALLRALARGPRTWHWWVVFVMASVAMLYTHYFGALLLLAYALYVVILVASRVLRPDTRAAARQEFAPALISAGAIALLYAPWLPAMLRRYVVDRSYWQGSLKLGEALRHVAISFAVGAPETMLEPDALRLLPGFGLITVCCLLLLAWDALRWRRENAATGKAPTNRHSVLSCQSAADPLGFLLLALLVPIAAVLLLASRTPKFNARYLMLASPAYLLILGGGIGVLADLTLEHEGTKAREELRARRHPSRPHRIISLLAVATMVIFLVLASARSIRNWFTDPAFTKAQWREIAAAVRAARGPDEAVLLVSGHAWPAWDYYAPDIAAVRLPSLDILDVNAVLGFDAGRSLSRGLQGMTGIWLVSWQEDTVDPVGFVPYFLNRAGQEQPSDGQFWQLKLRHWQLGPDASYPDTPQPEHADGANYAHKLALLGWDSPKRGQITLYWMALNTILKDYKVSLVLEDAAGNALGRWDSRPAGYLYPTTHWQPHQALVGQYPLPLPAQPPPGDLYLTVAVYDDEDPSGLDIMDVADNPAGKRIRIGPLQHLLVAPQPAGCFDAGLSVC